MPNVAGRKHISQQSAELTERDLASDTLGVPNSLRDDRD
jgi:hypothetical protein